MSNEKGPPLTSTLNQSQQSLISHNSNPTSLYLSPPLVLTDDEAPPFKISADDYFSRTQPISKNKKTTHQCGHHGTPFKTRGSMDRPTKSSTHHDTVSICKGGNEIPGRKMSAIAKLAIKKTAGDHEKDDENAKGSFNIQRVAPDGGMLESLSFARAATFGRSRGHMLLGSKAPAIASVVTTTVLKSVTNNKEDGICHTDSRQDSFSLPELDHFRRNDAFRTGNRRKSTFSKRQLETPATIILRKASRAYQPTSFKPTTSLPRPSDMDNVPPFPAESRERLLRWLPNLQITTSVEEEAGGDSPSQAPLLGFRLLRSSGSSNFTCHRRCSLPAEPAVTYAEMQGSSTSPTGDRRSSQQSNAYARKRSKSRVWTSNSTYEVIWNKDDTPSSVTTRSAHSSQPKSPTEPPEPRKSPVHMAWQRSAMPRSASEPLHLLVEREDEDDEEPAPSTFTREEHDQMQDWAWPVPSTSREIDQLSIKEPPSTISLDFGARITQAPKSRSQSERPAFQVESVQSFPPLPSRNCTSDWRRLPLVDLNDPKAGREGSTDSLASNTGLVIAEPPTVTVDPAKTGLLIGSSSHVRRMSSVIKGRRLSAISGAAILGQAVGRIWKHRRSLSDGCQSPIIADKKFPYRRPASIQIIPASKAQSLDREESFLQQIDLRAESGLLSGEERDLDTVENADSEEDIDAVPYRPVHVEKRARSIFIR
ncbi:hypothetical protein MMC25_000251 [Agyrium rufum]|nr:hypothetical protein [Agyrium rufum]